MYIFAQVKAIALAEYLSKSMMSRTVLNNMLGTRARALRAQAKKQKEAFALSQDAIQPDADN